MHRSPRFPGVLILFVGVAGLAGCGGKQEPEENQAATHLRKIVQAYDEVTYRNRRPPRSVDDLRPVLTEMCGPEGLDAFLRSPNDGEPYEIVWGVNLERVADGSTLLAYEKKGVEGKRYAINAARVVKQMTDEEIQKAGSPKGKKPGGG